MDELYLLLMLGAVSGLLGGMLGIGGGVVLVPALILILDQSGSLSGSAVTLVAVGTSMACIVFTSASAAYTQYRSDKILWPVFRQMTPLFLLGSLSAGLLAPMLDAAMLRVLIGAFLLAVGVIMFSRWSPPASRPLPGPLGSSAVAYTGGLMSGTAGIAGGNIIVPTLVFFNVPMHNATATSSAMGVLIALAGAAGYAAGVGAELTTNRPMLGYIDLTYWITLTLCAVLTAPIGVRLAHRVPAAQLKRGFGILLLIVALRMIYSAAGLS